MPAASSPADLLRDWRALGGVQASDAWVCGALPMQKRRPCSGLVCCQVQGAGMQRRIAQYDPADLVCEAKSLVLIQLRFRPFLFLPHSP